MTAPSRIVIIGAGQSGFWCAKELRNNNFPGEVVLLGDEFHPPYDRPPLSKATLTGNATIESTYYMTAADLAGIGVVFRTGDPAVAIDRAGKTVRTRDGDSIAYEHLVIATGARVRPLPIPGAADVNVLYLRNIGDCLVLQREIRPGRRVLVIGGGLIGLEVAAAATKLGAAASVIEAAPRVMSRSVDEKVSRHFEAIHRRNGVEIFTQSLPQRIDVVADGVRVHCADGNVVEGDVIIAGIGIIPNDELAARAGLTTGNGLWIDDFLRTSDPSISGIGDVANQLVPQLGRRIRLETWQNAKNQGAAAARILCGEAKPYRDNPWGWSDQFGTNLQLLGLTERLEGGILRGDPEQGSFSVIRLNENRIAGIIAVNAVRDVAAVRRLMAENIEVDPRLLADSTVPLKSLLSASSSGSATRTPA